MINKDRVVNSFLELVKIPSQTYNERKVADYIMDELNSIGIEAYEDNAGEVLSGNAGNIIATIKGNINKRILISAHMDTVTPCDTITPIVEDEVIRTDKTSILGADDKSGISAILEMIKVIKENNIDHSEIVIVFSVAEEAGLRGAKVLDFNKLGKIDYAYILDGAGDVGICYNKAPYSANGKYKIVGKAAHAGEEPEKGINSLVVASHAINNIKVGRIDEDTTFSIGKVSGGNATNIVLSELVIEFESRSIYEDKLKNLLKEVTNVFEESCRLHNATLISDISLGQTAGYIIEESSDIVRTYKKCVENLGYEFMLKSTGGKSDTNKYNMLGIPAINISTGMENIHSTEEYIKVDNLVALPKLLIELIQSK